MTTTKTRDEVLARMIEQHNETEAVGRVLDAFLPAERELGPVGIDTFTVHVQLELFADQQDIAVAMKHGVVEQIVEDAVLQDLWKLTDFGIEMIEQRLQVVKVLTGERDEFGDPVYVKMTHAELDAENKRHEELRRNYKPTPAEAALLTALEQHMTYDVDAFGVDAFTAHQVASALTAAGFEIVLAPKSEPETAEDRHRREVDILTSFTYDDLRAKLASMSIEEAAAELGVSVALVEEWRGRLGVVDWRPGS